MSLINEAIKKANQANKDKSAESTRSASPGSTSGMKSAGRSSSPPSGSMTGMFIVAGVVIFVLLGGFLLVLGMKNRTATPAQSVENVQAVVVPDATASAQMRASKAPSNISTDSKADPVVVHSSIDDVMREANPHLAEQIEEPIEEPAPQPKPAGPPEFPPLKLQGIFYRLNNPSVIVNGKTLWMNQSISDVKVIKIERSAVTVEFDGRTKVLRLE